MFINLLNYTSLNINLDNHDWEPWALGLNHVIGNILIKLKNASSYFRWWWSNSLSDVFRWEEKKSSALVSFPVLLMHCGGGGTSQ